MTSPSKIRNWFDRALDMAATLREARESFNEMKTEDEEGRMDWARLRALAIAHDADLHDEKKKDRVSKLLAKGTYASWYADIIGIGKDEQNASIRSSSQFPSVPVSSKSPPSARDSDGAAGPANGIKGPAASNSESRDGGESRPAVRTHNSHLVGPVSDHARGGGCPAGIASGSRDTNSSFGVKQGEGPAANSTHSRPAPLVATAGDVGGPGEAVATRDDPYNCIPDFCVRT